MRKTIILVIGLLVVIALAGIVFGTDIIVKTQNKEFQKDPGFYKSLGNYLTGKGDSANAIIAYESCLLLGDDDEVRNNLAILYYQSGKYDEAISQLRILVQRSPDHPSYHYDLAINLVDRFRNTDNQNIADLEEAFAEFEKANILQPGYAHSQENIEALKRILNK